MGEKLIFVESTIRRQGKESVYCKICEVCYDKESKIFYSDCRQSPGKKSRLFLCFSYPQFFFVELLYQEKSVCYPPDSFIQSIPFVV